MIISFDLDETLISNKFEAEKSNWFHQFLGVESLRKGIIDLFKELKNKIIKFIFTPLRTEVNPG